MITDDRDTYDPDAPADLADRLEYHTGRLAWMHHEDIKADILAAAAAIRRLRGELAGLGRRDGHRVGSAS